MKNSNDIIRQLKKDIDKLQYRIDHKYLYALEKLLKTGTIYTGIALDYAIPYILVALVSLNSKDTNIPFQIDEIPKKVKIESIDTSKGEHIENRVTYDYIDTKIMHSTGWIKKSNNYERTVTTYRVFTTINDAYLKTLLTMKPEELYQMFSVQSIETISVSSLSIEDEIYKDDVIIAVTYKLTNDLVMCPETEYENIKNTVAFLVSTFLKGLGIQLVGKIFFKTYLRDRLRDYLPKYCTTTSEELQHFEQMLEIKKDNLNRILDYNHQAFSRNLRK